MITANELVFTWFSVLCIVLSILFSMLILRSSYGNKHQFFSKILIAFVIILFVFFIIAMRMILVDIGFLHAFSNNATNATIGV
jgi:hypothetical protein